MGEVIEQEFIYNLMTLQSQQSEQQTDNVFKLVATLIVIIFIWLWVKVKRARKRNKHLNRKSANVSVQKIIFALEIQDFFLQYTTRQQDGFTPFQIQNEENFVTKLVSKMFGLGNFYRLIFSLQKIKEFVVGLKNLPQVQLYIYTSLSPIVANILIEKLNLSSYFPETHRKYCLLDSMDALKHPVQIDRQTKRVVIITPSHDDHTYEDDKYFLVLRPKTDQMNYLKNTLKTLKDFVEGTQDINSLHENLDQLKVNQESDWSDYDL